MSEALDQVVARAVKDESFRSLLFSDPDAALSGYSVTDEERSLLSGLNEDNFDEFAGGLGPRQTQGRWIPGTG